MSEFNVMKDFNNIVKLKEWNWDILFTDYERIYPWTNENLRKFFDDFSLLNKKILTVTSSGDHFLNLVLAGASDITCFDINRLTKYYQELKIAYIKLFDYEEFKNILYSNLSKDVLLRYFKGNKALFLNILNKEVYDFWKLTLSNYEADGIMSYDVADSSFENNEYFNEEKYNKLKKNLENIKPIYIDADIADLNLILKEQYDYIFTSNIFSHLMRTGAHTKAFDNLITVLKPNGKIIQYSFNPHYTNDLFFEKRSKYDVKIIYKYEDVEDDQYESIISYGFKH